jgi:hypothetical protein
MASPFAVRSFRFQWPADLATSWAFEMEALILGWYILESTGSVQQLVLVAALVWLGSLFSPFFGVAGDRIGHRTLLCLTRGIYALLAAVLTALIWSGSLQAWHVFTIAGIAGLIRPSDNVMRHVLVGQTIPPNLLMRTLGISRTTSDSARVIGALTGTAGVALLGMGPVYALVTAMYVAAFALSLGVARGQPHPITEHPLAGLKQGFRYVWNKPELLGAFTLAFLVNLLAFPLFLGLLPYVAKDVYGAGQAGLGWLAASFWSGALIGSIAVGARQFSGHAARVMLWNGALWFAGILVFGQTTWLAFGVVLLFGIGFVQSFCLTPLAAVMLRSSDEVMRGRVMGVRMLAIWGLPLGLLAAGPLIAAIGYVATTVLYGGLGLAATAAIGYAWRQALWNRAAAANKA